MKNLLVKSVHKLRGSVVIPSDKSISHRAVMFASLACGKSVINNFSNGADPLSSLSVCKKLGVNVEFKDEKTLIINSDGKLKMPELSLDCGNSGTTMRLMCGILAGQEFNSVLNGDGSLSKRPMKRVIEPLTLMGANFVAENYRAPIRVWGGDLQGISYSSKLSSAQVKSCVLLAGLQACGNTSYSEPELSRNHTELMLKYMNADIEMDGTTTIIRKSVLEPRTINVAGDISSAAYFIAAASIVPDSDIILCNVGLNPTRTGIIDVVRQMGGNIEILDERIVSGELVGDIRVKHANLKSCTIEGAIIPRLIDELPVIAVLAALAEGETVVKDAGDLRNKETDRIATVVGELKKIGVDIEAREDGFVVNGKPFLNGGAELETYGDHRLAMSFYVAGLVCKNEILIKNFDWVKISFPEFEELFNKIISE